MVERVNRVLIPMLGKIIDSSTSSHWYKMLEEIEYALNNTVHKTTKEIPSKLLFGIVQRGKITDQLWEFINNNINYKKWKLQDIRNSAAERIKTCQEYHKNYFDKKRKNMNIKPVIMPCFTITKILLE